MAGLAVGPFSGTVVAVALSALLAWLLARGVAGRAMADHRRAAGSMVFDALLIGLLVARAVYVLRWWPEYTASAWAILAIGDGGFVWWGGLPAALGWVLWRTRGTTALRRAVLSGIGAGMVAWLLIGVISNQLQRSAPPLPAIALVQLDGTPVSMQQFLGRPVVLNLWASWCPPCRREMPALAAAQAMYPDVAVVFINQGETAAAVRAYLEAQHLMLDHVLLDGQSRAMPTLGVRGLPTTLFYDAEGRLRDRHMGELTRARLTDILQRRFDVRAVTGAGFDDVSGDDPPVAASKGVR